MTFSCVRSGHFGVCEITKIGCPTSYPINMAPHVTGSDHPVDEMTELGQNYA
jgi:hypothetical protein